MLSLEERYAWSHVADVMVDSGWWVFGGHAPRGVGAVLFDRDLNLQVIQLVGIGFGERSFVGVFGGLVDGRELWIAPQFGEGHTLPNEVDEPFRCVTSACLAAVSQRG